MIREREQKTEIWLCGKMERQRERESERQERNESLKTKGRLDLLCD